MSLFKWRPNIIRWRPRTKISRNLLGTIMATNKQWIYATYTKTNVCATIKMCVFLSWNAVFLLWWFRWISLLKLSIFLDITCVHLKWFDKRAFAYHGSLFVCSAWINCRCVMKTNLTDPNWYELLQKVLRGNSCLLYLISVEVRVFRTHWRQFIANISLSLSMVSFYGPDVSQMIVLF